MLKPSFVLLWFLVLVPTAQSAPQSTKRIEALNVRERTPWTLFGGFGGGYGMVFGREYSEAPDGGHFMINALMSYEAKSWVYDGGLGWMYSAVRGSNNFDQYVSVRTRAGLMNLGARYLLSDRWQLGPALDLAYGADTTYAQTVGRANATVFLGLKGVYEFPVVKTPVRLWAQASTDLTIKDRQAAFALVGVQIGMPIERKVSREEWDTIRSSSASRDREGELRVVLDAQQVFFGTNSSRLRPEVLDALDEVGDYLDSHGKEWQSVEISGHADQRGRYLYNLKLSERRAREVRDAMNLNSKTSGRANVRAFSYTRPVDPGNNPKAWSLNRRVELLFRGVTDPEALIKRIQPLTALGPTEK